jgi:hypothetical protein
LIDAAGKRRNQPSMDLLTRLNKIAADFGLNGANDARLAIAACALLDRNNDVVIDARDIPATLARLEVPRYLGSFVSPTYMEAAGVHLTAKAGDYAILTQGAGGMVIFTEVPRQYFVHIGVNFDRKEPAAPNQPEWLDSYLVRGNRLNFVNSAGAYLSGFYADAPNQSFIDVSQTSADPLQFTLDVLIVPDPAVPTTYTELFYVSPAETVDGNVDEYTFDEEQGGDYVEGNRVGDPTGEIPLHFQPAVGFSD